MDKKVDDPEVMEIVWDIANRCSKRGLVVSVGGGITPKNAAIIAQKIKPNKINTRNLVFDLEKCPDISEAISKSLDFEIALLNHRANLLKKEYDSLIRRIKVLEERKRQK
jgi:hypothetical protein